MPQKSQKTSRFCTSTTPIPAEGRNFSEEAPSHRDEKKKEINISIIILLRKRGHAGEDYAGCNDFTGLWQHHGHSAFAGFGVRGFNSRWWCFSRICLALCRTMLCRLGSCLSFLFRVGFRMSGHFRHESVRSSLHRSLLENFVNFWSHTVHNGCSRVGLVLLGSLAPKTSFILAIEVKSCAAL